jgi:hypothetical protein
MATELPDRFELRHAATDHPTFVVLPAQAILRLPIEA